MVLWGSAEGYGKGVVAGTFLMIRPLREGDAPDGALWRVTVNGIKAELGLPRHLFEFGTIVLRPEVVEAFSRPSALMLCPTKTITCTGKSIGSSFRATQHDGEWTRVVSNTGEAGWVQLRQLGAEPNETVEFTGALASYFRGDLDQAERLFGTTVGTAAADSLVRDDARILQAASRSRLGRAASAQIDEILRNDPFSRYALQVAVMDALQSRARGAEGARDRIITLAGRVRRKEELFQPDDPWFRSVMAISSSLEQ
jgi:hypothetical protein